MAGGFCTALCALQDICRVRPLLRIFTAREGGRAEDVKCWRRKGKKSVHWVRKNPFALIQCVCHLFLFFSSLFFPFLCCKDEVQRAQIKAERDKNGSRNWRCLELYFFKGGWRTEHRRALTYQSAISMPEVLSQVALRARWTQGLAQLLCWARETIRERWLGLAPHCQSGPSKEKSSCERSPAGHGHLGCLHPHNPSVHK